MSHAERPAARPPVDGSRRDAVNRRLARAIQAAIGRRQQLPDDATTDMRLRHLEVEVSEVRTRVNGLFFAVLGSLALEVIGKVAQ